MKTSEIFQHAKKYLAATYLQIDKAQQQQFICWSLATARCERLISYGAESKAKRIIQDRLNIGAVRCSTLEQWLKENHGVKMPGRTTSDRTERRYVNKMQTTRHAWVDSLIAEFAAKGD